MSGLQVLFLLLALAYVGGFLMGGRGLKGVGLPSGSEWLLAGFVIGPAGLGGVGSEDLAAFAPVAVVAVAWVALISGLRVGDSGQGPGRWSGLVAGLAGGTLSFGMVAGAVWLALEHVPSIASFLHDPHDRLVAAVGIGAALADTSRQALRWAVERLGAAGPLVDRLVLFTQGDDLVGLVAVGHLVASDASRGVSALPAGGLALGAAMGLLGAALLGRRIRSATVAWSVLFGVSLLVAGVAQQVDLLPLTALFATGLALAIASPLRATLRQMAAHVEGAVVVPALFIAGAWLPLPQGPGFLLVAIALLARVLAKAVAGTAMSLASADARRAGPAMALALLPAGPLSVAVGLAVYMRYPGPAGGVVLGAAAGAAILGEFVGAPALRAAVAPRSAPPPAAAPAPDPGATP